MWAVPCSAAPPPGTTCVGISELIWLASALFNVGVELHGAGQYAAAVPAFQAAVTAAAACLQAAAGSSQEVRGIL